MKFLVDMPVTPQAVPHLESKGHEAALAVSIGLATEPDSVLLEHARHHAQIVVTSTSTSRACWPSTKPRRRA